MLKAIIVFIGLAASITANAQSSFKPYVGTYEVTSVVSMTGLKCSESEIAKLCVKKNDSVIIESSEVSAVLRVEHSQGVISKYKWTNST